MRWRWELLNPKWERMMIADVIRIGNFHRIVRIWAELRRMDNICLRSRKMYRQEKHRIMMPNSHSWRGEASKGIIPKSFCQRCKVQDQMSGQDKVLTEATAKDQEGEWQLGERSKLELQEQINISGLRDEAKPCIK